MKVLKIAFGHPDNVLSLCARLAEEVDLTLVFVVSGDRFRQGVLDIDLRALGFGLLTDERHFQRTFPPPIVAFMKGRCRIWLLRLPSLKLLNLRNLQLYRNAISYLRKESFEVVHYNGFSPYIFLFYQGFKDAAQFWTLHDYKNHSGEKNIKAETINRLLARLKHLTVIQHYEYLRQQVIQAFQLPRGKVRTLFSGPLEVLQSFKASYELCPSGPYVLFFGRISRYKGVDVLLQAYRAIDSAKPRLVIAGSGDFWFDLGPYEEDPNIVFLHQYIENEQLLGLIERSAFIVVPYRDATHSAVIATAYVCNKPVVASDVDGLKEVVHEGLTGRLVAPGSPEKLRKTMEDLFRDPAQLETYAINIEKEKQQGKIAWPAIIENYLALYAGKWKELKT